MRDRKRKGRMKKAKYDTREKEGIEGDKNDVERMKKVKES